MELPTLPRNPEAPVMKSDRSLNSSPILGSIVFTFKTAFKGINLTKNTGKEANITSGFRLSEGTVECGGGGAIGGRRDRVREMR